MILLNIAINRWLLHLCYISIGYEGFCWRKTSMWMVLSLTLIALVTLILGEYWKKQGETSDKAHFGSLDRRLSYLAALLVSSFIAIWIYHGLPHGACWIVAIEY